MKKNIYVLTAILAIGIFAISCQSEMAPTESNDDNISILSKKNDCATIPQGNLYTSSGDLITPGFMENGYNYQAHLYNGDYYGDGWKLVMKWNDAWLANKDCDGDGLLDRHAGYDTYIGSGAWCTNHWSTTYTNADGKECSYVEFTKIVAVPADANKVDGIWYNADGVEIGPDIWGQFAIIQSIINDPCEGTHGVDYKSPDHPGLGNW